ncbi:Protein-only RNase P [seawater metagenome]|uniref:ribonuclease P n=1 Tax=seawater metagenome TaxID=1561972 RepID=A0A5E8CJN9_9ZZZZ
MEVYTDKTINILFKENKLELILKFFQNKIKLGEKINQSFFNRLLIGLEKNQDYETLLTSYSHASDNSCISIHEQTITIVIRTYLEINNLHDAFLTLTKLDESQIKKRTLILFFNYYYLNGKVDEIYEFYISNLKGKFVLNNEDYNKLLNVIFINNRKDLYFKLIGNIQGKKIIFEYPINTNFSINGCYLNQKNQCSNCNNKIKRINLSISERKILLSNLKNSYLTSDTDKELFKKFVKFVKNINNIKIVIDGGNILYFGDRKINFNSYHKLNLIIKKVLKKYDPKHVLLIIHNRHKTFIKKNFNSGVSQKIEDILKEWETKIKVYYTPFNMNDDWFIVYAGIIYHNSLIISNDLMKDHKFKIGQEIDFEDLFSKWVEISRIEFNFKNKKYNFNNTELSFPNSFSMRVQKNGDHYHIPSINGKWVCVHNI